MPLGLYKSFTHPDRKQLDRSKKAFRHYSIFDQRYVKVSLSSNMGASCSNQVDIEYNFESIREDFLLWLTKNRMMYLYQCLSSVVDEYITIYHDELKNINIDNLRQILEDDFWKYFDANSERLKG